MGAETDSLWYKLFNYGLEFFGMYYSTYRAFVIDNNDPEHMGRVKVSVPMVFSNDTTGIWAFPNGLWGGKNYGIGLLPEIGDMVFVEFEHGDMDYPIWQHGGYAKGEMPEVFNDPNNYGFITPHGNEIVIEDGEDEDSGLIRVKYKNGEYFLVKKELLEVDAKEIKIGKDAIEPAVLGTTITEQLNTILTTLVNLCTELSIHGHPSNGAPPSDAANFVNLATELNDSIAELDKTLSQKVKVE